MRVSVFLPYPYAVCTVCISSLNLSLEVAVRHGYPMIQQYVIQCAPSAEKCNPNHYIGAGARSSMNTLVHASRNRPSGG